MTKQYLAVAAILTLAVFGTPVLTHASGMTDSDDLTIQAEIVQALTIDCQSLDFGSIMSGAAGGTVSLSADGTATYGGSTSSVGGSSSRGECAVSGAGNQNYDISLPQSATLSDGNGNTMTVNNFTAGTGTGPAVQMGSAAFGNDGQSTLQIGADLIVAPNQRAGTYTGAATITVMYQ